MADKRDGHQNGIGGMLTGVPLLPGKLAEVGAADGWSSGPSADQRPRKRSGAIRRFARSSFGVQTGTADNFGRMLTALALARCRLRRAARRAFETLFASASADPAQREQGTVASGVGAGLREERRRRSPRARARIGSG